MLNRIRKRLKAWEKPLLAAVLFTLVSFLFGFWFAKGVQQAGGLVNITVEYSDTDGP